MVLKELIFQIEHLDTHQQRLQFLSALEQALQAPHPVEERKYLKSLLYHPDWYIRREVAILIDQYGNALTEDEQFQYAFALQQFAWLYDRIEDPRARKQLFQGCRDGHPRIRSKAVAYLTPEDCLCPEDEAAYLYARGDYLALIELGCTAEGRNAVVAVLQSGLQNPDNAAYHRRQCAFALEQLEAIEDAQSEIQAILTANLPSTAESVSAEPLLEFPPHASPLERLLYFLNHQGVWLDGQRVFPEIQVGTVTGRITYKNPPLQTLPTAERHRRLMPPEGELVSLDYRVIEPTILLHYLIRGFYLNMEDLPRGDLYLAITPHNRNQGKRWLNTLINGGMPSLGEEWTPFQRKLFEAVREFQQEILAEAQTQGYVTTIGGNQLPLPESSGNRIGRIMNRLIQGSASDVFNQAAIRIFEWLHEQQTDVRIYFLLYDELWLQGPAEAIARVLATVKEIMETIPGELGLLLPISVRMTHLTERR